MKRTLIIFILPLLVLSVAAQVNKYGTPLMKSYSTQFMKGSDYTHSIIKDQNGNMYFANEDMGIIRYNGYSWRTIPVRNNSLIRALGIDNQGIIYAGGKFEFGYLEPDNYGKMTYVSLSQRIDDLNNKKLKDTVSIKKDSILSGIIDIGEILSLVVKDSNVYFVSNESLFDYNIAKDSISFVNLRKFGLTNVLRAFPVNDKIILGDNSAGLFEISDQEIKKLPQGDFFRYMRCMSILPYDKDMALVATYQNGIYIYNYVTGDIRKDFIDPDVIKQLIELRVYSGARLTSSEFALGTIGGGVFILDHSGKLIHQWNKDNSNLQDNGILAFYCDNNDNSELWISSVRFITKVYINLPFTEFSVKSSLEGVVNFINEFNGEIYVSTDNGVFKSTSSGDGIRKFVKISEIIDGVYPVIHARIGTEEFLLAGSINGIFQIRKNGKVVKVELETSTNQTEKERDLNVRIITQSKINPERFYIGCAIDVVTVIDYHSGKWKQVRKISIKQGIITGLVEIANGDIIISSDFSNSLFRVANNDSAPIPYGPDKGAPYASKISITETENDIILCTEKGLFRYIKASDSWEPCNDLTGDLSAGKECTGIIKEKDGSIWLGLNQNGRYSEMLIKESEGKKIFYEGPLALLPNVKMMDFKILDNRIWVAKSNKVFVIDEEKLLKKAATLMPLITKIVAGRDSILMEESFYRRGLSGKRIPLPTQTGGKTPELKYNLNSVSFFWATPYYVDEEATIYSYKLDGFDRDWSVWDRVNYKDYTNLPFGRYSFRVKSRTATEIGTNEAVYEFFILKPWYLTAWMIILYTIIVVLIIIVIIKAYTRKLKNENLRLEGIVAERTAVVVKQKEELESSIHYASRIQMALLPSEAILSENLKNYFILFKPRDIVSGDFYWMTKKNNRLYIVAADSTGHGVPGAFMSLLGMSFLDEIIDKEKAPRADHILSELRHHVTESLKQVGGDDEAKDGMDMALLVVDFNKSRIEFSGAYNPCFRVRKMTEEEAKNFHDENMEMPDGSMSNGKYLLETIFASKMPIGISSRMNEKFVFYDWNLEHGVSYYLFSDGYIDQFGGPKGRKFMKKNFKRFLLEMQDYPMNKQKELMEQNLKSWMGQSPQIDDILVMGIRTD